MVVDGTCVCAHRGQRPLLGTFLNSSLPYLFSFYNKVSLNQELIDWLDLPGSQPLDHLVSALSTSVHYRCILS